ncbi:hypothetical protein OYE22_23525 [Streptomyces sp. 71268]|uniref:hypothetical protein n=1 Tax=Streptomyces sp. 71268 TaxID=3002640 RepID=UPI0023FA027D|nr:hypothetical protein [Streptomyces sp. 71268]WEV27818.1 hypothetical protein OYE22_23525 [Streptomyces sp. 71268]
MGDWVLTATPPGSPRGFTRAHLQRGAECVQLRYCQAELADLAATIKGIETDFARRCDALRASGGAESARAPASRFETPFADQRAPLPQDRHA